MNINGLLWASNSLKLMQKAQATSKDKANGGIEIKTTSPEADHFRADRIAKRIARGEHVSEADRRFLEEKDSEKYMKARFANQNRQMTEAQLRSAKGKNNMKQIIQAAKLSALTTSKTDADYTSLCCEGVQELEGRYLKGKRKKSSSVFIDIPQKNTAAVKTAADKMIDIKV